MSLDQIQKNFQEASELLDAFTANNANFEAIESAGRILVDALKSGNKIISCGNGGSMSDAMHFAEELSGKFRDERGAIAAVSISDSSHITCTANDYGFEYIFSRYVEALGKEGDVLLAISTSGNSANILKAIEAAKKKGMKVVSLTGNDGGAMASLCDVEIRVPHSGYSDRIQEVHIKIIHSLIHFVELNS